MNVLPSWAHTVNCLDRHVHTCPERVALIWERDEKGSEVKYTYRLVNGAVLIDIPSSSVCEVQLNVFAESYWR